MRNPEITDWEIIKILISEVKIKRKTYEKDKRLLSKAKDSNDTEVTILPWRGFTRSVLSEIIPKYSYSIKKGSEKIYGERALSKRNIYDRLLHLEKLRIVKKVKGTKPFKYIIPKTFHTLQLIFVTDRTTFPVGLNKGNEYYQEALYQVSKRLRLSQDELIKELEEIKTNYWITYQDYLEKKTSRDYFLREYLKIKNNIKADREIRKLF